MTIKQNELPAIGSAFQGGFFAGLLNIDGQLHGLIVAPKAAGELEEARWGEYGNDIAGATSVYDGLANTQAMAEVGSDLAKWALELEIDSFTDWYLPSRDELEILYRQFKPTTETNYQYGRHGENSSAVPITQHYSAEAPAQTSHEAFQEGAEQAFEDAWYWSSTQYSPYNAWYQDFAGGSQLSHHKDSELRARAVRRFTVTP
ncbi:DUF1566 domain-containing protein [Pseudomonas sp. EggHat1]|uniref:Lcl domain-containing protein n=1 Tax=Pseudomonas sp. EggHat1 TaxID=2761624 RepID=UPI0018662C66|nr:DUF1566 domain-containing protein [Pseudomonas sp. EggHat1]